MSFPIELQDRSAQPTLTIRTHAPVRQLGHVLGPAFGSVMQYLGELGEQPAGAGFAAYYNDDMQNLDMAIGFPVSKSLPGKGDIRAGEIPAGRYATCLYTGPYSHISAAYAALAQWIKDKGYEATDVAYETYLDDPSNTPPAELKTLVMQPLKVNGE